jgi:4-amino-4-deoxy-L-arabinose transferase-like glycosyltransferase
MGNAAAARDIASHSEIASSPRTTQILAAILIASAVLYSLHLGANSLGGSEAYSAWAASKPSVAAIIQTPVMDDPGKQVFYYVVLHYFSRIFGLSEIALRSMSVVLGLVSLVLIFTLGREMFDDETGLAAAAIWAFNPLAIVFAQTARMYPMFIAISLAHLLMLLRVRAHPSVARAISCGVLGAAVPYTHMAGLLIVGAEIAMLLRDLVQGRRNTMAWFAMILALGLFVPYVPVATRQSHDLMYGHSLDYLGPALNYSLTQKVAAAALGAAFGIWLIFGRRLERNGDEPLRWLVAWGALPTLAFLVGSVVLHPMFNARYLSPGIAATSVLIAGGIGAWSIKWRNLVAAGFALICLIVSPFARAKPQPWRELARQVATEGGASEPVIFESGFVSNGKTASEPNAGFPFGYYSVVFDYYFRGPNAKVVVPGYDPQSARATIESKVLAAGGGWLATWKNEDSVQSELPDPKKFRIVKIHREPELGIYRITPIPH